MRGVFAWTGPSPAGRDVVLVDDLVTSGATAAAAACVLAAAGAARVTVLCFARTV
jgi:predicted amidophosphoribosyltransferase